MTASENKVRLGIDFGSRFVKMAWTRDLEHFQYRKFDSIPFLKNQVRRAKDQYLLTLDGINLPVPEKIVVTGYGKTFLSPPLPSITEIRAHFKGALHQVPLRDFILIEMGGQDTKVLLVEGGRLFDFQTNDKCAAGTGRYIENMARLLDLDLEAFSGFTKGPVPITNTCATFGETEIMGLIMEGMPFSAIAAGVNDSLARRVLSWIKRYPPYPLILAGGVALNQGMVHFLGKRSGREVGVLKEPQYSGAVGCAVEEEV